MTNGLSFRTSSHIVGFEIDLNVDTLSVLRKDGRH